MMRFFAVCTPTSMVPGALYADIRSATACAQRLLAGCGQTDVWIEEHAPCDRGILCVDAGPAETPGPTLVRRLPVLPLPPPRPPADSDQ